MTLTKLDQQNLMDGDHFNYSSDDHDLEAWFDNDAGWQGGYKIWFNGTFVHVSKTYKSFEKKLEQLIAQYGLAQQ